MTDYGVKIMKPGRSITSANPNDYYFWSKYASKSIKRQFSISATTVTGVDPNDAQVIFTHDFGYLPQFMVFTTSAVESKYVNLDFTTTIAYGKGGDNQRESLQAYVTESQIVISAEYVYYTPMAGFTNGLAHTYTFDVLLFMEEIAA